MYIPRVLIALLLLTPYLSVHAGTPIPAPPSLHSTGYVLMDHATGDFLLEKNPDTALEPASLTKIMTAFISFNEVKEGRIGLDDMVLVSEKAWKTGGSRMFIEVGKRVSVNDLLHGLIIQSGNDAAVALAEYIAGTEEEFANLMNVQAKALGMKNTHYVNATGWPAEGHITTARDLAILTRAMILRFPEHYAWHAIKEYEYNDIEQYNRNKLLWQDKTVDGVKTGHTDAAGYCLVASAKRQDMRLISVVLGTDSENARARASSRLLNYGFRFYESRVLYKAGESLSKTRIWKGSQQQLKLGVAEDVVISIPRGDYKLLKAELEFNNHITAPVKSGTPLGNVIIRLEGKTITTRPLVALEDVSEGSLWTRMIDSARLMIE